MNINGFVKNFGNRSFEEMPFSDVDALILAELSYVNLDLVSPFVEEGGFVRLKDLIIEDYEALTYGSVDAKKNELLLRRVKNAPRYADMEVGMNRRKFDKRHANQFFATTFRFGTFSYIAFRGTDITLTGWKEDFFLVFEKKIKAQEQAAEYVQDVVKQVNGPFYFGGHSKGGNLAEYAALMLSPDQQERLLGVYSFDGPGSMTDMRALSSFPALESRFAKYLTHNDMIGVVYNRIENPKIVYATGLLFGGHDPFSWHVDPNTGRFVERKTRTKFSLRYEKAFNRWLDSISLDYRRVACEILFNIFSHCKTVYDLPLYAGIDLIRQNEVLKKYPKKDVAEVKTLLRRLLRYYIEAGKDED